MFGSDDHKTDPSGDNQGVDATAPAVDAGSPTDTTTSAPADNFSPSPAAPQPASDTASDATSVTPTAAPVISPAVSPADSAAPSTDLPTPLAPASTDATLSPAMAGPATGATGDLMGLKQKALEQLKPLVDHLDSVPEEKFDALMMMIRASDDQALIEPAYDTAQKITDDKKRAEALLDVVNEINYLTSTQQ